MVLDYTHHLVVTNTVDTIPVRNATNKPEERQRKIWDCLNSNNFKIETNNEIQLNNGRKHTMCRTVLRRKNRTKGAH